MPDLVLRIEASDGETGETVRFEQSCVRLGRSEQCEVSIDSDLVSRHHADLYVSRNRHWRVRDHGSTNHTLLNGDVVESAELAPGDVVRLAPAGPRVHVLECSVRAPLKEPKARRRSAKPRPEVTSPPRRRRVLVWTGAVVLVGALGTGFLLLRNDLFPKQTPPATPSTVSTPSTPRRTATEDLHDEVMPITEPTPELALRSVTRVEAWIVYRRLRGDAPWTPTATPLVDQSPLVIEGGTVFCAGRLSSADGVLWVVELEDPHPGLSASTARGEPLPLIAAGPDPFSCVVLPTAAERRDAASRPLRCAVFRAPRCAAVQLEETPLVPRSADLELPVSGDAGEIGEIDLPPRLASLAGEAGDDVLFRSDLPGDLPARIAALCTPQVQQTLVTRDVGGTEVPLLVAWGGRIQVAGRIELTGRLETAVRIEGVAAIFESLVSGEAGAVLPAMVARDLVHAVPGVKP